MLSQSIVRLIFLRNKIKHTRTHSRLCSVSHYRHAVASSSVDGASFAATASMRIAPGRSHSLTLHFCSTSRRRIEEQNETIINKTEQIASKSFVRDDLGECQLNAQRREMRREVPETKQNQIQTKSVTINNATTTTTTTSNRIRIRRSIGIDIDIEYQANAFCSAPSQSMCTKSLSEST